MHYAVNVEDAAALLIRVNQDLTPTRRFYDYRQANRYAEDCFDTVSLLEGCARGATPDLIPVIERAITLMTRAIVKSDDSSGLQGDQIQGLLDAHAEAVRTTSPPLTQQEQSRLIKWILKYRYGGDQDFFDPDIVAYAPGLTKKSLAKYRVEIKARDLGPYGTYPLTRLAVLDGDREAIIAANGGEPTGAMRALMIVSDLDDAGLRDAAITYATLGIELDDRGFDDRLVQFLVSDALDRHEGERAIEVRKSWFNRYPTAKSFDALSAVARQIGVWERERAAAEAIFAAVDAASFTGYLLRDTRGDEAWAFATEHVDVLQRPNVWVDLCKHRVKTHASDVIPVYRAVIAQTLETASHQNYRDAASLLRHLQNAAAAAGPQTTAEFREFVALLAEQNRRRPRCIEAFTRAGLIQ